MPQSHAHGHTSNLNYSPYMSMIRLQPIHCMTRGIQQRQKPATGAFMELACLNQSKPVAWRWLRTKLNSLRFTIQFSARSNGSMSLEMNLNCFLIGVTDLPNLFLIGCEANSSTQPGPAATGFCAVASSGEWR